MNNNRDASDAVEQIMKMLNQTSLFTQLQDMQLEEYEKIEKGMYEIIDKWSKSNG